MLIFRYFVILFSITLFINAQASKLIINVPNRSGISLNGEWDYIIDPYEAGYYDYRNQPLQNGYFKNAKPQNKSERIEYNFDSGCSLHVPGDWNSQDEKLFLYEGTIWYKK